MAWVTFPPFGHELVITNESTNSGAHVKEERERELGEWMDGWMDGGIIVALEQLSAAVIDLRACPSYHVKPICIQHSIAYCSMACQSTPSTAAHSIAAHRMRPCESPCCYSVACSWPSLARLASHPHFFPYRPDQII